MVVCRNHEVDDPVMRAIDRAPFSIGRLQDELPAKTLLQQGTIRLDNVLGRGGFGITYTAFSYELNRVVAVKEFFPEGCGRIEMSVFPHNEQAFDLALKRYLRNGKLFALLRHPHIVHVFDCFEENGTAYLVMELLQGQTLQQQIETGGPLPAERVGDIIKSIGAGLEAVHRLNLLHLDIKPDNIMVGADDDRFVLFDFDLVREIESPTCRRTRSLAETIRCGTPGYAALEQYSPEGRVDVRTDIYALGATAYSLLHGQPPLPAPERVFIDDEQDKSGVLYRAINHALAIAIDDRPDSIGELLDELQGRFRPAPLPQKSRQTLPLRDGWCDIKVKELPELWPERCACCGGVSHRERYNMKVGNAEIAVPCCPDCIYHVHTAHNAGLFTTCGMIGGLLMAFIGYFFSNLVLGPAGVVIHFGAMAYGILKISRADMQMKHECPDRKQPITYRRLGALHVLKFRNAGYATEFHELNQELVA